jgi:hypothetical protein
MELVSDIKKVVVTFYDQRHSDENFSKTSDKNLSNNFTQLPFIGANIQ